MQFVLSKGSGVAGRNSPPEWFGAKILEVTSYLSEEEKQARKAIF